MQYGNFYLPLKIVNFFRLFKSYYVVWKQEDEENKKDKQTKFKSYYVVWKPRYGSFEAKSTNSFKSYYVVWKPFVLWECSRIVNFV